MKVPAARSVTQTVARNGILAFVGAVLYVASGCSSLGTTASSSPKAFPLTIAHLNDTHSHLDPTTVSVTVNGEKRSLTLGGFPRIATLIKTLRREKPVLFLHAGDAFQGSLYFTKYQGKADWELLNLLGVDAMTLGNHEFDKGPALVAELVDNAAFPIVAANVDVSEEPVLAGKIPPYTILQVGGEPVGIIGLALAETANISRPGERIRFADPVRTAQASVSLLLNRGINKIIILSHNGFDFDLELARSVPEIDVIVGGHTHTLLGPPELKAAGLSPHGPYPTVVEGPARNKVLVVTAWEWGKVLGVLDLVFDANGDIVSFAGKPLLVDQQLHEDPGARRKLDEYRSGIEVLERQVVAVAVDDLPRYDSRRRPVLGRLIADSMLWKARSVDPKVALAVHNAGGVRADIVRGKVSVGSIMSVLPFDNSLVLIDLKGSELREALEHAADAAVHGKIRGPLIVSGARHDLNDRSVEVAGPDGSFHPLDESVTYRIVTNSYLASGGDYSTVFRNAAGRRDLPISDAEAFIEYATAVKELRQPGAVPLPFVPVSGEVQSSLMPSVLSSPRDFFPTPIISMHLFLSCDLQSLFCPIS